MFNSDSLDLTLLGLIIYLHDKITIEIVFSICISSDSSEYDGNLSSSIK